MVNVLLLFVQLALLNATLTVGVCFVVNIGQGGALIGMSRSSPRMKLQSTVLVTINLPAVAWLLPLLLLEHRLRYFTFTLVKPSVISGQNSTGAGSNGGHIGGEQSYIGSGKSGIAQSAIKLKSTLQGDSVMHVLLNSAIGHGDGDDDELDIN